MIVEGLGNSEGRLLVVPTVPQPATLGRKGDEESECSIQRMVGDFGEGNARCRA